MKTVYLLERGLNKLSDGRVNPTYSIPNVLARKIHGFMWLKENLGLG